MIERFRDWVSGEGGVKGGAVGVVVVVVVVVLLVVVVGAWVCVAVACVTWFKAVPGR